MTTSSSALASNGFPVPQANSLLRVGETALYVKAGLTTAEAVGEEFPHNRSKTPANAHRDGRYYLDAAGYLGLVRKARKGRSMDFELTEAGERFVALDENGRRAYLASLAASSPLMQAFAYSKGSGLFDRLTADGMGAETARRRISTAYSWASALGTAVSRDHRDAPTSKRQTKQKQPVAKAIIGESYTPRGNPVIETLHEFLEGKGYTDIRSGVSREGAFDIGWERGNEVIIANHAETGSRSHRDRIRYAEGRIAEHRRYVEALGGRNVRCVIITSGDLEEADLFLNAEYDKRKTLVVNADDLKALVRRGLV